MHIFGGQKSDSHGYYRTAVTSDISTNATTENYIGIAAGTVSSGATATIDVSGATNSSQSSLTAGQKYYVQKDGSLGLTATTPKVFAGTAIAATKLIVNDQAPPAGADMGMWKLVASADLDTYSGNEYDIFTDFENRTEKWWKLVFFLEAPDGSNDFSGCGLRVKTQNTWRATGYDIQYFYVESTNETANRYNSSTRYAFALDQKWHRGEFTFYDPSSDGYTLFEYTGFSANHAWQGTTDSPNPERSAGGYVGNTHPVKGIRFWKNSGNFGKIHYGLFASNGW